MKVRGGAAAAGPSRTGQVVAMTRAGLDRPHTQGGDPAAQARLCAGMRPAQLRRPRRGGMGSAGVSYLGPHLAARTRFFDDQVLGALRRGVTQIVILGAGYDDRALRFPAPGVRYFELDHPATQSDKRRRLAGMTVPPGGLTLAAADFRRDDVAAVLAASGHDAGRASLFMCEGLLVYLDQPAIVALLAGLRSRAGQDRAGPGSTLAASLAVHPGRADSDLVARQANAARPAGRAEPWLTILPEAAQRGLLRRAGWHVTEAVDDTTLDHRARPGRSLLVVASPAAPGG